MTRRCIRLAALTLSLSIAGCESVPVDDAVSIAGREQAYARHQAWVATLVRFRGSGRVALRTADDALSASLDWRQDREAYEVRMSGPFGQGSMRIQGTPGAVTLETSEGRTSHATNPEELLARELGWRVPVSVLRYWIVGSTAPGLDVAQLEVDGSGRIRRMQQAGFDVRYLAYAGVESGALPRQLDIQGPDLRLRLVMTRWTTS